MRHELYELLKIYVQLLYNILYKDRQAEGTGYTGIEAEWTG